jgi:hypothetical protein
LGTTSNGAAWIAPVPGAIRPTFSFTSFRDRQAYLDYFKTIPLELSTFYEQAVIRVLTKKESCL